jgi:hypothetical protein
MRLRERRVIGVLKVEVMRTGSRRWYVVRGDRVIIINPKRHPR